MYHSRSSDAAGVFWMVYLALCVLWGLLWWGLQKLFGFDLQLTGRDLLWFWVGGPALLGFLLWKLATWIDRRRPGHEPR